MKVCFVCRKELTSSNACLNIIRKGGRCRPCNAKDWRDRYASLTPEELIVARKKNTERMVRSYIPKVTSEQRAEIKRRKEEAELRKAEKRASRILAKEREGIRKWSTAFYGKIFQPRVCLECKRPFETLYPHQYPRETVQGQTLCYSCQKDRRRMRHGKYKIKCAYYGVPFKDFNIAKIFTRDNWACQRCGIDTPEIKRGTYEEDAPELDHIWALSLISRIQGIKVKSPGHIPENCQCLCRKCNGEKSNNITASVVFSHHRMSKESLIRASAR